MSPTKFYDNGLRFFFYSREGQRMHIHVRGSDGEAKYWIEPKICQARSNKMKARELRLIKQKIEERIDEIKRNWRKHFGS